MILAYIFLAIIVAVLGGGMMLSYIIFSLNALCVLASAKGIRKHLNATRHECMRFTVFTGLALLLSPYPFVFQLLGKYECDTTIKVLMIVVFFILLYSFVAFFRVHRDYNKLVLEMNSEELRNGVKNGDLIEESDAERIFGKPSDRFPPDNDYMHSVLIYKEAKVIILFGYAHRFSDIDSCSLSCGIDEDCSTVKIYFNEKKFGAMALTVNDEMSARKLHSFIQGVIQWDSSVAKGCLWPY